MELTNEMIQKINVLLADEPELKEKILIGDAEGIRNLGHISQQGLMPEDIIKLCEEGKLEEIYKKAKLLIEMKIMYNELCNIYCEINNSSHRTK